MGAEFILGFMIMPWVIFVTISIFSSQKAEAVLENKYDTILENLKEIKENVSVIKQSFK